MRNVVVAVVALLLVAGCGNSESVVAEKPKPAKPLVDVRGVIKVDDLNNIRYDQAADACVSRGDLAMLKVGEAPVVIKDPSGKQVALGRISETQYKKVEMNGQTYAAPGWCNFTFAAASVPKETGVYTAEIPELDASARFEPGSSVVITIR